ncbi:MAG: hypothetical protein QOG65_2086 [Actinomycetota bacterium]|nr:hypothetical protein [Actinomycetota bacterium]
MSSTRTEPTAPTIAIFTTGFAVAVEGAVVEVLADGCALGDTDAFDDDPHAARAKVATIPNVSARACLIFICIATDLVCVFSGAF